MQDVLIEVSIAGEEAKAGVAIERCPGASSRQAARLKNISIKGLMTMPPFRTIPSRCGPTFEGYGAVPRASTSENIPDVSMQELSMGMSGDFEVAIEEGATMVRVGTAIFGERK